MSKITRVVNSLNLWVGIHYHLDIGNPIVHHPNYEKETRNNLIA